MHDFGGADGQYPIGSVLQATNGLFYGTTGYGGASGDGQIFSLSVGLRPFVKTVPAFGKSGAPVIILGNRLRSATGVTFNGRATSFKVISAFQIMALVPPGATTVIVKVRTPRGTLSSNVPFQVLRQ